jgi:nucleoside-diphosphate-sugar epimerase
MSIILVSGVNGFIGSHIAERLISGGHSVRGLVRKSSVLILIQDLDIELFYGDVTNEGSLLEPMKNVEIVIHVAGLASDWGPYKDFYAVNVQGTKNIAISANKNHVKRFVYISTAALHGFQNRKNIDESFPLAKTIFPYCETKKEAEQWLFNFAKTVSMEVTAVRPGNVFGPRDHTFIDKYLDALKDGKMAFVNRGRNLTCPTYIENLVDGIILACFESSAKGKTFIITDGLEITWKTFTNKLADELGVKRPSLSVPYWLGYGLAFLMENIYKAFRISHPPLLTRYRISNAGRDYHFSIEKAKNILNYQPAVGIDEAITKTVNWYKKRKRTPVKPVDM